MRAPAALALAALAGAGWAQPPPPLPSSSPPSLVAVVPPDLSTMEAPVRQAIAERQRAAEAIDPAADPAAAAAAYGELGRLYLHFEQDGPAAAALANARVLAPRDFRWAYLLGALDEDEGRFADAVELLEEAVALKPEDVAAWVRLGRSRLAANDVGGAREAFAAARQRDPTSAAALYGLGRVAAAAGNAAEAVELFEQALAAQPGATAIHYPLALAYRELGDLERARRELARRGPVEVSFPDPLLAPPEVTLGSAGHLVQGNRAMQQGALAEAIARYRAGVEADPQDPQLHRALAVALGRAGDLEGAVEQYRAALAIDPKNAAYHYNLGTVLVSLDRLDEAVEHFRAAVELFPDYTDARFNLAAALLRQGRLEEAEGHFRRLLELAPEDREARVQLAVVLTREGRSADAAAELERVLAVDPEHPAARAGLAEIERQRAAELGRRGRYREAADAFHRAVELAPQEADARFGEAMALLLGEVYGEARSRLEAAVQALPDDLALRHALARLLATCPEAAVRDGKRALELSLAVFDRARTPEHAETVAMAYAEVGRFDDAAEWQRRIVAEAERAGRSDLLPVLRQRLALYESGRPVRSPWREGGAPPAGR